MNVLRVMVSNGDNQQHSSYVDPAWLLLLKNAVMFGDLFDMKLLSGCDFDASEEEDSTSRSEDDGGPVPGIPETISFTLSGASDHGADCIGRHKLLQQKCRSTLYNHCATTRDHSQIELPILCADQSSTEQYLLSIVIKHNG